MIINYRNNSRTPRTKYKSTLVFGYKVAFWGTVALFISFLLSATLPQRSTSPLVLKSEQLPFTPKEFYIADVVDARTDRKTVAHLIPVAASGAAPAKTAQPVDLQGGGLAALKQFISKGMKQNTSLRPITIRLKEMSIKEMPAQHGRVEGKAVVGMEFEVERDGELVKLSEYRGGMRYIRPANQADVAEPALRQSLVEALKYLNTWINKEANTNERLAKGIKVSFTDYQTAATKDTVFYSPARPLRWDDFTGSPTKPSKYAAAIFPSFDYVGNTEVVNGIVHVNLQMKVYMLPGSSWVKSGHLDTYGLNHEQKHFDIAKLVAERFKRKITPDILSVADYNSIIQYHYIESFREMNQLQEQYDAETQHGLNEAAQAKWNKKLEEELGNL